MILNDILNIIESVAPVQWQEAWDNSGLQIGERNATIDRVLLTVDVTEAVIDEAIRRKCQLILSHHPLLFHGIKQITGATSQARCVQRAIEHHIAIYSAHTSMDSALHGVSGRMADKIGLQNQRILMPNPTYGSQVGLGIIGTLPQPLPLHRFIDHIKTTFDAPWLRYTQGKSDTIHTVALCGGAGAEFIPNAIQQGADAYITADCKYHEMQAAASDITVVDMDHWVSEHFTREIFAELLQDKVECIIARSDQSPILAV